MGNGIHCDTKGKGFPKTIFFIRGIPTCITEVVGETPSDPTTLQGTVFQKLGYGAKLLPFDHWKRKRFDPPGFCEAVPQQRRGRQFPGRRDHFPKRGNHVQGKEAKNP